MPGIPSRILALALVTLVAGCGRSLRGPIHPTEDGILRVDDCPTFVAPDTVIAITPEGSDSIPLGPNHFLRVAPGAVAEPVQYRVSPLVIQQGRKAGIQVDFLGQGAPPDFLEPVLLHLSFSGCNFPGGPKYMVRYPGGNANPRSLGGGMSRNREYVEAFVQKFSGFAIAI